MHRLELLHQLVLVDALELDAVAGAQQEWVLPEDRVSGADVVDRKRAPDQLVAARRLDGIDRVTGAADPECALGRPGPRRVVLRHEDRVARIEREHEREPGEEADERGPLLRPEHRLVELVAIAEAVVANDVVDVGAALGVGCVLADRVDVALDGGPRLQVVECDRQLYEPARDRDSAFGSQLVVQTPQVVDELRGRDHRGVVADEHRAESGSGFDQALRRTGGKRIACCEDEKVEREVEDHLAVLDQDGAVTCEAVGDARLAVLLGRLADDHGGGCGAHRAIVCRSASGASSMSARSSASLIALAISGAFGASP